jgi:hypothetical protein
VTLGEFYQRIEDLASTLAVAGRVTDGSAVMDALRGGSTSGEILANLSVVLRPLRSEQGPIVAEVEALWAFIEQAHRPQR